MSRDHPLKAIFNPPIRYGEPTYTAQVGTPTVTATVNQGGSQLDPTSDQPVIFDLVFSEAVTGLTSGDIVLSGTATGSASVSVIDSGDHINYTIEVSSLVPGTVTVSVPAGVATSIATGAPNNAATTTDDTVTYVVYPAEFVFAAGWHGVNGTGVAEYLIEIPDASGWLPGDFVVVMARNTNGGTITLPSWLTRIDGAGATDNPACAVGVITDGLTEFPGVIRYSYEGERRPCVVFTYSEGTAAAWDQVMAVFRNTGGAGAAVHESFDHTPTPNYSIGPIDIPDDGEGLLIGAATDTGNTHYVMSAATPLLIAENNSRLQRAFGVAGPASGYSFVHDGVAPSALDSSNDFYATPLSPGALSYDPQGTISYVGAGADATANGGTGTLSVPLPSGLQADDLLVIVTHANDNAGDGFQPESGWTLYGRYYNHARDVKFYFKRALGGGADTAPTLDSYSGSGMSNRQAKMFAYRGVAAVQAVHGASAQTYSPHWNTPADNCVALAGMAGDFYSISSLTLSGYTQRAILNHPGGSGGGLALADKAIATAGTNPGFPTIVQSGGSTGSCYLVYLIPA